jgi:hypothetical protein
MFYAVGAPIACGVLAVDEAACREIDDAHELAQAAGDDLGVSFTKYTKGLILLHGNPADRARGVELLTEVRELTVGGRFYLSELPVIEVYLARERARHGDVDDVDDAVNRMRTALGVLFERGQYAWGIATSAVLVGTLLARGGDGDLAEAEKVTDRLETAPLEMAAEAIDVWMLRMRAMLADARGEDRRYRDHRDRYRTLATSLGFEGHVQWAAAMR